MRTPIDTRPRPKPALPRPIAVVRSAESESDDADPDSDELLGLSVVGSIPSCLRVLTQKPMMAKMRVACRRITIYGRFKI